MSTPATDRRATVRLFLVTLAGVILVQTAWALVVPPFRGIDEHDHAFKAAAVARGDWSGKHEAGPTRGEFMAAPRDLVEAATPVCESYRYTGPDNCRPQGSAGDGMVRVATSASRYNPAFYFVMGTAARAFNGTAALYAMRAVSALVSALLLALAAVAVRRWARTRWPAVAFLLTATPTMLYTTSVAAPNGVEVAGAMLVWSALLGLVALPEDRRWFLAMATVGALPLVVARSIGPLWCFLIVVGIGMLLGFSGLRDLLRRRVTWICAGIVVAFTVGAVGWSMTASTNVPPAADPNAADYPAVWGVLPNEMILWVLQSVGAFPLRDEVARPGVYALVLSAWAVLTLLAWRVARGSERLTLAFVVAVSAVVPLTATIMTYDSLGTSWQGRYQYPFTMGFLLVCGLALDRSRTTAPRWVVWAAAAAMTAAQAIGQLGVLAGESLNSPLAGTEAWHAPSPLLVIALVVAACLILAYACSLMRTAVPAEVELPVGSLRP